MSAPDTTLTYRRLRADAPVGVMARVCLELHPKRVACARCTQACPVGVLRLTDAGMNLDDGCLGCGRCVAACPTGALAVHGFSLAPVPESTPVALTLDCWRVPGNLSPPGSVRVPCLGGLNVSHLLALRFAGGSRQLVLHDRGWCGDCAAGKGGCHPAEAAVAATRDWLGEIGAPASHWPTLVKQPLPVSSRRQTILDDNETIATISRRSFVSRLAREVATTVSEVSGFRLGDNSAGKPVRPVNSLAPVRPIERERQLLLLEHLAARYGGSVPARFFPRVEIGAECADHRLCVVLCPTGALGVYRNPHGGGVTFEAAACIACSQCEQVCPERALHLSARTAAARPQEGAIVLTRHMQRTCIDCGETFACAGRETRCRACRKSRGFARAGFDSFFRDGPDSPKRHKNRAD